MDTTTFEYEIEMPDGTEVRGEADIYARNGEVSVERIWGAERYRPDTADWAKTPLARLDEDTLRAAIQSQAAGSAEALEDEIINACIDHAADLAVSAAREDY